MTHVINWFELPTTDFDRAIDFYTTVLDREIELWNPDEATDSNGRAAMFQTEEGEVSGMLVETAEFTTESGATVSYKPTADSGPVVYFNVEGDLDDTLTNVESNGGEILVPTEAIPDSMGHYAIITDSEGNRVGLMSSQ